MDPQHKRIVVWIVIASKLSVIQFITTSTPLGCIVIGLSWFILLLWALVALLRLPARLETPEPEKDMSWIELFMDEFMQDTQFPMPMLWLVTSINTHVTTRAMMSALTHASDVFLFTVTGVIGAIMVTYKLAESRQDAGL